MDEEKIELGDFRNSDRLTVTSRKGTILRSSINENSLVR